VIAAVPACPARSATWPTKAQRRGCRKASRPTSTRRAGAISAPEWSREFEDPIVLGRYVNKRTPPEGVHGRGSQYGGFSQHPEKLGRNQAVPRKSIATRAGSKSEPSRILLNIRLLSEVRFSGHKRTAPPKRSMTPAALASPEAPEIPSVRMCMQYGYQRSIIKQGGRQPACANRRAVVIVVSAASRERRSAARCASGPIGAGASCLLLGKLKAMGQHPG
jgi:hypothetical protein